MKTIKLLLILVSISISQTTKPDLISVISFGEAMGQELSGAKIMKTLHCPYCSNHPILRYNGFYFPESEQTNIYTSGKRDTVKIEEYYNINSYQIKCESCGGIETTIGRDSLVVVKQYRVLCKNILNTRIKN